MKERQKINWLLILQGWAMMWVVIGHAGPAGSVDEYPSYAVFLYRFAYSFHMPLFITISGFLYFLTRLDNEKWGYSETMKEKLERFGIPFVVFTLVGMIMKSAFAGSVDRPTTISFGEFFHALIYPGKGPMGEFWFIGAIMWFFALFPLWKILIRNTRLSIVALLVLAAISIWHPGSEFLASSHVSKYAFYFYIGIICATLYKKNPEFITSRKFTLPSFMVGFLVYIVGRSLRLPVITPLGGG